MYRMMIVSALLSFSMIASAQNTPTPTTDTNQVETHDASHHHGKSGKKYRGKKGHRSCDTDECKARREQWKKQRAERGDKDSAEWQEKRAQRHAQRGAQGDADHQARREQWRKNHAERQKQKEIEQN